jgi:hypothetical protein
MILLIITNEKFVFWAYKSCYKYKFEFYGLKIDL